MKTDAEFLKIAAPAMRDESPLTVTISISDAWFLVAALQFATRHPAIVGQMKAIIEHVARQFQAAIVAKHPATAELLEMGWNPDHDRPQGG
jgi:hypothetical protein